MNINVQMYSSIAYTPINFQLSLDSALYPLAKSFQVHWKFRWLENDPPKIRCSLPSWIRKSSVK